MESNERNAFEKHTSLLCRNCGNEIAFGSLRAEGKSININDIDIPIYYGEWNYELCEMCGLEIDNGIVTTIPHLHIEGKLFEKGKKPPL